MKINTKTLLLIALVTKTFLPVQLSAAAMADGITTGWPATAHGASYAELCVSSRRVATTTTNDVDVTVDNDFYAAACRGDLDIVNSFIAAGAEVNGRHYSSSKPTLLYTAASNHQTKIVKALLAAGANVNALDHNYRTPICLAVCKDYSIKYKKSTMSMLQCLKKL